MNTKNEYLKQALDLERKCDSLRDRKSIIENECFYDPPKPPIKRTVVEKQPVVKSQLKCDYKKALAPLKYISIATGVTILLALITNGFLFAFLIVFEILIGIPVGLLCFLNYRMFTFTKIRLQDEERIRNSPEFREYAQKLKQEYESDLKAAEAQYLAEYNNYETALASYNKKKLDWMYDRNDRLASVALDLQNAKIELQRAYQDLPEIPSMYRTRDVLEQVYEIVSTSNYTIKEAIDVYDRNRQIDIQTQRLSEQRRSNDIQEDQLYAQYEANDIADQARRDRNRAEAVRAYQHHQTNKHLKNIAKH